jgi:hypothetical protein
MTGGAELLRRADADRDRAAAYVDAHPDEYAWTHVAGPADHRRRRAWIFPLFAMGATSALDRGPLLERLAARGITAEVRPVRYGSQRGEQALLECTAG